MALHFKLAEDMVESIGETAKNLLDEDDEH